MLRSLMAILVSMSLVFGTASTSAFAAPVLPNSQAELVQPADANALPLPAGGAAGIKEAQAFGIENPWLGVGLVVGVVLIAFLLMHDDDDDDDDGPPTTGT